VGHGPAHGTLPVGRILLNLGQQRALLVSDKAGIFHGAIRAFKQSDVIQLAEGIRNAGIFFQTRE
jgi:hypothetical protein